MISQIFFDKERNPYFTYATEIGSYRGAYRYGDLTYVKTSTTTTPIDLILPIIIISVSVVVAVCLIIYRVKKAFSRTVNG
jgi:hypothetical protein